MRGWLAGRSLARGLPAPVADHGGWRVDTGDDEETARYVFAEAGPGLVALGETITAPRVFLKLCADHDALRALLPARWEVLASNCMMVRAGATVPVSTLPDGYGAEIVEAGAVSHVRILNETGELAASGYAAEHDGVFVYDRIRTEEAHQRRGLGTAVMTRLGAMRRSPASREVLTATPAGRALYLALGWRVLTPYTTAILPQ